MEFGRDWALPGVLLAAPLFETNISRISHVSAIIIRILCLCTAYNSEIILAKIVAYYS